MNVALKELVESRMWLKIIALSGYLDPATIEPLVAETDELVKIFHSSVSTARKTMASESPNS